MNEGQMWIGAGEGPRLHPEQILEKRFENSVRSRGPDWRRSGPHPERNSSRNISMLGLIGAGFLSRADLQSGFYSRFTPDQVLDRFRKLERLGVALKPRDKLASSAASARSLSCR